MGLEMSDPEVTGFQEYYAETEEAKMSKLATENDTLKTQHEQDEKQHKEDLEAIEDLKVSLENSTEALADYATQIDKRDERIRKLEAEKNFYEWCRG
jgi:hypothetical protein